MESRDTSLNISPLDNRYWDANPGLFEGLAGTLSERAAIRYMVRAEAALLRAHMAEREVLDTEENRSAVDALEELVSPEMVAGEEAKTRHNVRALVNVIQGYLPDSIGHWVHLGATSADILDSANAVRIGDAMRGTIIPLVLDVLDELVLIAEREAETPQVGRTHGQFAVPVTFGFAVAEYVSRLGQSAVELARRTGELRGKLSGAVGAYNAMSLISGNPRELEARFLGFLGLKAAGYANQIVEPEPLLRLLLEVNTGFGILANLADDLRHLQRSEIAEISETFGEDQVGSSTMPQKRNPWNCEHVKSLWKAFSPRVMTFFMDQISEHQRDLSNSASGRFVADFLAGFGAAAARMLGILRGLSVKREAMGFNLRSMGDSVLAEPVYIILALDGRVDAHECIRSATLRAERENVSLRSVLVFDDEIRGILDERLEGKGLDVESFFDDPALYCGLAVERTREIVDEYRKVSSDLRSGLGSGKEKG